MRDEHGRRPAGCGKGGNAGPIRTLRTSRRRSLLRRQMDDAPITGRTRGQAYAPRQAETENDRVGLAGRRSGGAGHQDQKRRSPVGSLALRDRCAIGQSVRHCNGLSAVNTKDEFGMRGQLLVALPWG